VAEMSRFLMFNNKIKSKIIEKQSDRLSKFENLNHLEILRRYIEEVKS